MTFYTLIKIGFNEETWKKYSKHVAKLAAKETPLMNEDPELMRVFNEIKFRHPVIDFYLPHDFGGLADGKAPRYSQVNVFTENMDLP